MSSLITKRARHAYVRNKDSGFGVGVPTRERHRLVRLSRLRAANVHLRARRVELGTAGGDSKVERNDLVPDEVLARGDIIGEGYGHRLAVHCGIIRQEWKADNEGDALMSCWYHVDPSGFIPSWSTLNHWASVELYLSHVPSHLAM